MPNDINLDAIIQYGQQHGVLDSDSTLDDKKQFVLEYARRKAKSEDEFNKFTQLAETKFQEMHLNEVDPTGEYRKKGSASKAFREQAGPLETVAQGASDFAMGAASGLMKTGGGIAGVFSPDLGKYLRRNAEQLEIANDNPSQHLMGQAGSFAPMMAGGLVSAGAQMFGQAAGTAQEQGSEGFKSVVPGAISAGIGLGGGLVGGKYLASKITPLGEGAASRIASNEVTQAFVVRQAQGAAGDVAFGVSAPVGQAAADTLVIGPHQGLEDLKEIPSAILGNLMFGRALGIPHDIAGARADILTKRTPYAPGEVGPVEPIRNFRQPDESAATDPTDIALAHADSVVSSYEANKRNPPLDDDARLEMHQQAYRDKLASIQHMLELQERVQNIAQTPGGLNQVRTEVDQKRQGAIADRAAENDLTIEQLATKYGMDPADAVAEGRSLSLEYRRQGMDPYDAADQAVIDMQKKLRGIATPIETEKDPVLAPSETEAFPQAILGEGQFTGKRTDVPQVQVTSPTTWEGRRHIIEREKSLKAQSKQERDARRQAYQAAQSLRQVNKRAGEEALKQLDEQYALEDAQVSSEYPVMEPPQVPASRFHEDTAQPAPIVKQAASAATGMEHTAESHAMEIAEIQSDQGQAGIQGNAPSSGKDVRGKGLKRGKKAGPEAGDAQEQVRYSRDTPIDTHAPAFVQEPGIAQVTPRGTKITKHADGHFTAETPSGFPIIIKTVPMMGSKGRIRSSEKGALIEISNGSKETVGHEIHHLNYDRFLTDSERKVLASRISDAEAQHILENRAKQGEQLTLEDARIEAMANRGSKYHAEGTLERTIQQRIIDLVKDIVHHFGLGHGSEKAILDRIYSGKYMERTARPSDEVLRNVRHSKEGDKPKRKVISAVKTVGKESKRAVTGVIARAFGDTRDLLKRHGEAELAEGVNKTEIQANQYAADFRPLVEEVAMKQKAASKHLEAARHDIVDRDDAFSDSRNKLAIEEGKPASKGMQDVINSLVRGITAQTGKVGKLLGLEASGKVPRMMTDEFRSLINGAFGKEAQKDFVERLAKANNMKFKDVWSHLIPEGMSEGQAEVNLSPMELRRKFNYMPEFYKHGGREFRLMETDPLTIARHIAEDSAHRFAYIKTFGKGYNPDLAALPEGYSTSNAAVQSIFTEWSRQFHNIGGSDNVFAKARSAIKQGPAGKALLNVADTSLAAVKSADLLTSGVQDIASLPNVMTRTGMGDFFKALSTYVTKRADSEQRARALNMIASLYHQSVNPDSHFSTVVNGLTAKMRTFKDYTENAAATVQFLASENFVRRVADGKVSARDESIIRDMGFNDRELRQIMDGGPERKMLMDEFIRRSVSAATGRQAVRTRQSPFSRSAIVREIGPGFTSWAEQQFRNYYRNVSSISEQAKAGNYKEAGKSFMNMTIAMAGLGIGYEAAKMFWDMVTGGQDKLNQDIQQQLANPGKSLLKIAMGGSLGGSLGALVNIGSAMDENKSIPESLADISYVWAKGKTAYNVAHEIATGIKTGTPAEGFMQAVRDATPATRRMVDAMLWAGFDQNAGAMANAESAYYNWEKANPEYATPMMKGGGGKHGDTTASLKQIVRMVKRGDRVTPEALRALFTSAAEEGLSDKDLAKSINGMRLLTRFDAKNADPAMLQSLYGSLGPATYAKLMHRDMLLESLAYMLK